MPTFQEAITFSSAAPKQTIRMVRSGEFFRAYNRSAWLFYSCIAEFKVMRKYVKTLKEDAIYMGCPAGRLFDLIDGLAWVKTDLGIDIDIAPDKLPDDEGYETWKAAVATEADSKGDFYSLPLSGAELYQEVAKKILAFPIESKTMVECTVFLSELRKVLLDNH